MEATRTEAPETGGSVDPRELALARRDLYRFLSASFLHEPGPDFFNLLHEPDFLAEVEKSFGPAIADSFRQVAEVTVVPEWSAVRQEFTQLFLVPGRAHIAPYESVFRDRREIEGREVSGLLMGQSTMDVRLWYRLAALEISPDFKELPDHIGLEFHYLAYLCEKELEFDDAGNAAKQTRAREMQRDFLKAHVLSWLGELAAQIRAKARVPLYPAIAALAVEFCQADLAQLEVDLGPSPGHPTPAYSP